MRCLKQFLVTDIKRSLQFYTEKLGFDIDFQYEDFYAGIVKDGCSIHLKVGKLHLRKEKIEELMSISARF
jgi:catechol 2,3-dioxygenase-like lactoylglutathione lyase family enzyme